eukprot:1047191-Pyramimonas_sp.AAC.1
MSLRIGTSSRLTEPSDGPGPHLDQNALTHRGQLVHVTCQVSAEPRQRAAPSLRLRAESGREADAKQMRSRCETDEKQMRNR